MHTIAPIDAVYRQSPRASPSRDEPISTTTDPSALTTHLSTQHFALRHNYAKHVHLQRECLRQSRSRARGKDECDSLRGPARGNLRLRTVAASHTSAFMPLAHSNMRDMYSRCAPARSIANVRAREDEGCACQEFRFV